MRMAISRTPNNYEYYVHMKGYGLQCQTIDPGAIVPMITLLILTIVERC